MSLRDYQTNAIDQIVKEWQMGLYRVLLIMPTGAGKTVVFCEMAKRALAKGKRVIVVVRGRDLVDQASKRLFRESVPHGVRMAKHWNYRPHEKMQVCSIDTLIARDEFPEADLVIVDEAHLATSPGFIKFMEKYPNAFVVAVTATPYPDKPMTHVAHTWVRPISMQKLIDDGFLVPFRYFAPSAPDLTGVKIDSKTHDYNSEQLGECMSKSALTGDIVAHWKSLGENRPTLLFAVNIKHSKFMVEMFQANGVAAEHCDADTSLTERKAIIERLERGETKVVSNVGVFCTGVDIPCLGCIIEARPTQSLNLFYQQCGRGTRLFPGKSDCIILDHAGNLIKHGFPTFEPEPCLDGKPKEEKGTAELKICKECFCAFQGSACPECGTEVVSVGRDGKWESVDEGELTEIKVTGKNPIEQWIDLLERQRKISRKKKAWVYYKLMEKFTIDECRPYLPQWFIDKQTGLSNVFGFSPYVGAGG